MIAIKKAALAKAATKAEQSTEISDTDQAP